jgi:hypothetical protein
MMFPTGVSACYLGVPAQRSIEPISRTDDPHFFSSIAFRTFAPQTSEITMARKLGTHPSSAPPLGLEDKEK